MIKSVLMLNQAMPIISDKIGTSYIFQVPEILHLISQWFSFIGSKSDGFGASSSLISFIQLSSAFGSAFSGTCTLGSVDKIIYIYIYISISVVQD